MSQTRGPAMVEGLYAPSARAHQGTGAERPGRARRTFPTPVAHHRRPPLCPVEGMVPLGRREDRAYGLAALEWVNAGLAETMSRGLQDMRASMHTPQPADLRAAACSWALRTMVTADAALGSWP